MNKVLPFYPALSVLESVCKTIKKFQLNKQIAQYYFKPKHLIKFQVQNARSEAGLCKALRGVPGGEMTDRTKSKAAICQQLTHYALVGMHALAFEQ